MVACCTIYSININKHSKEVDCTFEQSIFNFISLSAFRTFKLRDRPLMSEIAETSQINSTSDDTMLAKTPDNNSIVSWHSF